MKLYYMLLINEMTIYCYVRLRFRTHFSLLSPLCSVMDQTVLIHTYNYNNFMGSYYLGLSSMIDKAPISPKLNQL